MTDEHAPQVLPPCKSYEEARRLIHRYRPIDGVAYGYGTAGFRDNASVLECIMVRVGILAAVRSFQKQGQAMGVMVTASHNDESYNGVKLADPNGGMMEPDGEVLAVKLATAQTDDDVWNIVKSELQSAAGCSGNAVVHVGRDTRSHSPALTQLVVRAAQAMGATVVCHGIVTTPQLHHCVAHANPQFLPLVIPPRPNVLGYFDLTCQAYHSLLLTQDDPTILTTKKQLSPLVVDCACGVGYQHVQRLNHHLQQIGPNVCRPLLARNGPNDGPLNTKCGSEYVQKSILPPEFYGEGDSSSFAVTYGAALDGDADRIVFFRQSPDFLLLDGDKIAVLICNFLQKQLDLVLNEICDSGKSGDGMVDLRLGVVQTAYANGASTKYLQKVLGRDRVLIAKTGVKHVHAAAHENLDLGVYFEANGHGTVLFGSRFYDFLAWADRLVRRNVGLQRLRLLPSLVNQAVGDALSDLLLVDAILTLEKWDLDTWSSLYQDLPSRQCKVKVEDRSMIQTNESETRCIEPPSLQPALDAAMKDVSGGRCFVRPSGTENVVRVYAEALTGKDAGTLASKTVQLVHSLCKGVGEPPSFVASKM